MEEQEFLSRLFNLSMLPSTDDRFKDAAGDIWRHRVNNFDWGDDWIFYDGRFGLMNGDDENFLAFLCETIHPVVRPEPAEAERICQLYPVQAITRKSFRDMTRKLSVTESHRLAQFRGTLSRKKSSVASAN